MSKKTPDAHENLDLFSRADLPEHAAPKNGNLKPATPAAKPGRKTRRKTTSPTSVKEASKERYLRDTEVAQRYGVSRQTVWRWAEQEKLPGPIKFSQNATRWRLSDLLAHETSLSKGAKGTVVGSRRVKTHTAGKQS